jgi:cell division protein FtsX
MSVDPFTFAAFVVYLVVAGVLTLTVMVLLIKLVRLGRANAQLKVDVNVYLQELQKVLDAKDSTSIEETEGFIKFVSDSREKAFEYISNVQEAIEEYRKIADVVPLSHDMTVEQAEKLSKAYDNLMDFLPKEDLI